MYFVRHVRQKIVPLIEAWQKICILGERLIRKREAAAVRSTNTRPSSFIPHLRLPPALRMPSPLSISSSYSADSTPRMSLALPTAFSFLRDPASSLSSPSTAQADLSRLTNTLKTLAEVNGQCWKGQDCDLSDGVTQGINVVSAHTQRHADLLELRVCAWFVRPPPPFLIVTFLQCYENRLDWRVAAGYIGRSEGSPPNQYLSKPPSPSPPKFEL
jgi:sorting nexin-8